MSRTQERREGKRERVPMSGHRSKLQLSESDRKALDEAGFVPRWVNDVDGRVEQALAGGYVYVEPEEAKSVGQMALHEGNSDLNGRVSKIVSKGGGQPIRAYLMKIKKEFYDEDQAAKQARNDEIEDALRNGQPGGADTSSQYIPREGIAIR